MGRSNFIATAVGAMAIMFSSTTPAQQIPVRHVQHPMRRMMVAHSEDGKIIAMGEFTQLVQGDEVTMRLIYHFVDGSIDDEMTTYRQQGTFRFVRNRWAENLMASKSEIRHGEP